MNFRLPEAVVVFRSGGEYGNMLIEGWSSPEDSGVWTDGPESHIKIRLPTFAGRFKLSLTISPYLERTLVPKQRLTLVVERHIIYQSEIAYDQIIECYVPEFLTFDKSYIYIQFLLPDAVSPREIEQSDDTRLLAFKLISCEISQTEGSIIKPRCDTANGPGPVVSPVELSNELLMRAEPPKFADDTRVKFKYTRYPGSFGMSNHNEVIEIMNILIPLAQLPMQTNHDPNQSIRNRRVVAFDHVDLHGPVPICVYSVPNALLWAEGLVTKSTGFIMLWDCMPKYLRNRVDTEGHTFEIPVLEDRFWPKRKSIFSDVPISCPLHPNLIYGHFLLEMLPRFYVLMLLASLGTKFKVALPDSLPIWVEEYIGYYFEPSDIIRYDISIDCIIAPSVLIPSMMHNNHTFHPAFNLMVDDLHSRAISKQNANGSAKICFPERIYLSRTKLTSKKRLINEEEVEDLMYGLGFAIIHPQDLSLQDQLSMFRGAKIIAADYSSAIHGTIFAPFGTRVICINYYSSYQSNIGRLRQQPHCFVAPSDGEFRHWTMSSEENRFYSVNIGTLLEMVLSIFTPEEFAEYNVNRDI